MTIARDWEAIEHWCRYIDKRYVSAERNDSRWEARRYLRTLRELEMGLACDAGVDQARDQAERSAYAEYFGA